MTVLLNILPGSWTQKGYEVKGEVLHNLFISAFGGLEKPSDAVRDVLEILVRITLEYRDSTLAAKGRVLTVRDVRAALSWLVPCLATGNLPEIEDPVRLGLLVKWLEALKSPSDKDRTHRPSKKQPGGPCPDVIP